MNVLYNIIIAPIESIVDWVFLFIINKIEFVGVIGAVFGVSLAINFLALPLYNIADSLQEKERNIARSMENQIKRIKKAFKGDEQFMMLQTYYRQRHYHPLYTLRSSLSILIEIPFFIAAYHYLSHNTLLQGASWYIFSDLGSPDTFFSLHIGSFTLPVHILPILMTLINFVSGAIYTRGTPIREKIQLYGIGIIFLVLLYNSPSGLVLYWILNNLFSLCKNVVVKTKHPAAITHAFISILLLAFALYVLSRHGSLAKKTAIVLFTVFVSILPLIKRFLKKYLPEKAFLIGELPSQLPLFILSSLSLAIVSGFMLPARVIASSPVEFSFLAQTASPLSYIISSFFVFFGFFVFWPLAIYKMFDKTVRAILPALMFVLLVCFLTNVFVFSVPYGNLSVSFTLDDERVLKHFPRIFAVLPIFVMLLAFAVYELSLRIKKTSILSGLVCSVLFAGLSFGFAKTNEIQKVYKVHAANVAKYKSTESKNQENFEKIYHLSKTEKNVIVLFLDRAISAFFPKTIQQFPELEKSFEGFTYYPNTVSFSTHTSLGAPAMMGGYEYTPAGMNSRSNELLREKHNEAILLLPRLFSSAGFNAVVSDPPWSNYAHEGDLSPFEAYPEIKAYTTFGKYTSQFFNQIGIHGGIANNIADVVCRKEIRNFSVLQSLYPPARSIFYRLCRENSRRDDRTYYNIFSSLYYLDKQTDFTSSTNTYTFIDNDTPHEPHALDGSYLQISDAKKSREASHYDVNVAALLQVAKYLDFLRENGVYDNTRIIIVSDHGQSLNLKPFSAFTTPELPASYNPLLCVKDFNSKNEFYTDNTFMTNADALYFAKAGLPLADENPFTHKKFIPQKEDGVVVYPISNGEHHADHLLEKTMFTLDQSRAYHVESSIFEEKNWIPLNNWKNIKESN